MEEVAHGLQSLHTYDFFMRSLDPQSVFVESNGTVLLTNFELTKAVGNSISVSSNSTFEGLAYTSPNCGSKSDGQAVDDIYSFLAQCLFRNHWPALE